MKPIPLVLSLTCVIAMIVGLVGIHITGEVADIPVPPQGVGVGISPDPLPGLVGGGLLATAEVELTWDADVWVGVVTEEEANRCAPDGGLSTSCSGSSMEFVAGGPDTRDAGSLAWDVEAGTFQAAAGQPFGAGLDGSFDVAYDVHVKLAWPILMLLGLAGTGLAALAFPGMRI